MRVINQTKSLNFNFIYLYFLLYILGLRPVGVQCPSLHHYVSFQTIGTGSGILGFHPCWCPSLFLFYFHISVFFHSLFFTCNWISFVFLLYDWCICTQSTLHLQTFRWVSSLETDSGTQCCGPRGGAEVHMKQKSRFKFCRVWTSDLVVQLHVLNQINLYNKILTCTIRKREDLN